MLVEAKNYTLSTLQTTTTTMHHASKLGRSFTYSQNNAHHKVDHLLGGIADSAVSYISRLCSAVQRGFSWIDSYLSLPVVRAQALPVEPSFGEKLFLNKLEGTLKAYKISGHDRRYLRLVKDVVDGYMQKNGIIAFPAHMSRAVEMLAKGMSEAQFIDLGHGVPDFGGEKPISKDCFYHQINEVAKVNSLNRDEQMKAVSAVEALVEGYLSQRPTKLFTPDELNKFIEITNQMVSYHFYSGLLKSA